MINDPYECNAPNINFTLINEDDDRWDEFKEQRMERGFDNSELWALDSTITAFMIPRLERFLEVNPKAINDTEFINNIQSFLWSLRLFKESDGCLMFASDEQELQEKYEYGLSKFKDIFNGLWY